MKIKTPRVDYGEFEFFCKNCGTTFVAERNEYHIRTDEETSPKRGLINEIRGVYTRIEGHVLSCDCPRCEINCSAFIPLTSPVDFTWSV